MAVTARGDNPLRSPWLGYYGQANAAILRKSPETRSDTARSSVFTDWLFEQASSPTIGKKVAVYHRMRAG